MVGLENLPTMIKLTAHSALILPVNMQKMPAIQSDHSHDLHIMDGRHDLLLIIHGYE